MSVALITHKPTYSNSSLKLLPVINFSGLIIDAFGELRDQQEQVKKDMEVRFDNLSFTYALSDLKA